MSEESLVTSDAQERPSVAQNSATAKPSGLNIANIQKVRDHIAALPPERFDLSHWFFDPSASSFGWNHADWLGVTNAQALHGSCGTCGCIAGHALAALAPDDAVPASPGFAAAQLLQLSTEQRYDLFEPDPGTGLSIARSDVSRDQAVAVLDHLIATGEVDWSIIDTKAEGRDQ